MPEYAYSCDPKRNFTCAVHAAQIVLKNAEEEELIEALKKATREAMMEEDRLFTDDVTTGVTSHPTSKGELVTDSMWNQDLVNVQIALEADQIKKWLLACGFVSDGNDVLSISWSTQDGYDSLELVVNRVTNNLWWASLGNSKVGPQIAIGTIKSVADAERIYRALLLI